MDPLSQPQFPPPPIPVPAFMTTASPAVIAPIPYAPVAIHAAGAPPAPPPAAPDFPPQGASSATPNLPISTHDHPPYTDMIVAAITTLNERDGSSKRAIGKYIEQQYSNLPTNHSALLSHHLKRMKNAGELFMVKKSYKLPRSDSENHFPSAPPPASASDGPKRGRGRPPKPKSDVQSDPSQPNVEHNIQSNAQPMLVALGLADEPQPIAAKRGPGRPKKGDSPAGQKPRGRPRKVGLPLGPALAKRGPGRPPRPKSVQSVMGPSGLKKRPGRPPKAQAQATPVVIPYAPSVNAPDIAAVGGGGSNAANPSADNSITVMPNYAAGNDVTLVTGPRRRGRPRKDAAAGGGGAVVVPGIRRRGRGRPAGVTGKRRGRPPSIHGGVQKLRRSTGRPVGRPKKVDGDFKRKLEYLQSKVREAVGVLRPHITSDNSVNAVAAIQELEGLAAMDFNAPLFEEAQQQPQVIQNGEPMH